MIEKSFAPIVDIDDKFYDALIQVTMYIEDALRYNEQLYNDERKPRCASCGRTDNLTAGYAGGNEVVYCPRCKRDEEQR